MPGEWTFDDAVGYAASVLEGDLVRLRELHETDLAQLDAWWREATVLVFSTDVVRPPPQGAAGELFRRWSANQDAASGGFSIVSRDADTLLGYVGLFNVNAKDRNAEANIFIGPPYQGQGYGSDAMRVLVRYGFLELGLHRIELGVFAYNERAVAAYTKAGFVVEGRRRDRVLHGGAFHDDLVMGILRPDWERRQPQRNGPSPQDASG